MKNYGYIVTFETERTQRSTPPLPAKSTTTDLIYLSEGDMIDESEATSPDFKEGDAVFHQDNPEGPTDPTIPEDKEAKENAVSSEEETSLAATSTGNIMDNFQVSSSSSDSGSSSSAK